MQHTLKKHFFQGELFPQQSISATRPSPTTLSLPPIEQLSLGSTVAYIKQELDSDGFSPSSSLDSEFSPPADSNRDVCHLMAAYSTSLPLCQQQFEIGDSTPDCFGNDLSVFRYDHLAIGKLSPENGVETRAIKTEDSQLSLKVSFTHNYCKLPNKSPRASIF